MYAGTIMNRYCHILLIIGAFLPLLTQNAALGQRSGFARARQKLVEDVIMGSISEPRVIEAIATTPRHEFVPYKKRHLAYFDMAIPIGHQQTISPPLIVAYMTEKLDTKLSDRVLEIGTGSGYQAAVLSPLVNEVYSIEIVEPLGKKAASVLRRLKYKNVFTKVGDGYKGWPEKAPFDKIIVTCSPEDIPKPLVEQLAEGGKIVIPLGQRFSQTLVRFTKVDGKLEKEVLQPTFFVPMTGTAEENRKIKPNEVLTPLVNGGFEKAIGEKKIPDGWYYIRQGVVENSSDAKQGSHVLTFQNSTPGRHAHGMQAFGIDGRKVASIEIQLWVKGSELISNRQNQQSPRLFIEFYDQLRSPVGNGTMGPWNGSFEWVQQTGKIKVPKRARLAVMGIGLFGGTGKMSFDDVHVSVGRKR